MLVSYSVSGYVEKKRSDKVDVLLLVENSEAGEKIAESLLERDSLGFVYTFVPTREDMEVAIVRGKAPCGFIFTEDFDEAVKRGEPDGEVLIYQAADSTVGYTIKEVVYPEILSLAGSRIMSDYLEQIDADSEAADYVVNSYQKIQESSNLRIFDSAYVDVEDDASGENTSGKSDLTVTRMLTALLLLVLTLVSCFENLKECEGFFKVVSKQKRMLLSVISACTTLCMICVILYLHIVITNI